VLRVGNPSEIEYTIKKGSEIGKLIFVQVWTPEIKLSTLEQDEQPRDTETPKEQTAEKGD